MTAAETIDAIAAAHPRGTAQGLTWSIETYQRTAASDSPVIRQKYGHAYPHHVTGRIIDCGVERGAFDWYVPSIADPAYVFAGWPS